VGSILSVQDLVDFELLYSSPVLKSHVAWATGDHRWHISIQVGRIARAKNTINAEPQVVVLELLGKSLVNE
jgi:hypothetical protein